MQIEGITWHGLTLEPDQFATTKKLSLGLLSRQPGPFAHWLQARSYR